jgi:hypothetical protein
VFCLVAGGLLMDKLGGTAGTWGIPKVTVYTKMQNNKKFKPFICARKGDGCLLLRRDTGEKMCR